MPPWSGRHLLEGGDCRRYFGLNTIARGVVEFECRSHREYEVWTVGVSRLLALSVDKSNRHKIWRYLVLAICFCDQCIRINAFQVLWLCCYIPFVWICYNLTRILRIFWSKCNKQIKTDRVIYFSSMIFFCKVHLSVKKMGILGKKKYLGHWYLELSLYFNHLWGVFFFIFLLKLLTFVKINTPIYYPNVKVAN